MKLSSSWRPLLAATVVFLLLLISYKTAVHWSGPRAAVREVSAHFPAVIALNPSAIVTDSALMAEAGLAAEPLPSAPSISPPPAPPAAESLRCPAIPIGFTPPSLLERPVRLRRYVGTVGGQPTTILLQGRTPQELAGSFYQHRGGPTYSLSSPQWQGRRLVLRVAKVQEYDEGEQSEWYLTGWPGPLLRGTWHDTTGTYPLVLRESYEGAVRASVCTLVMGGGQLLPEYPSSECVAGSSVYEYLQLPAPQAVAPILRRALSPSPAVIRHQLRARYEESRHQHRTLPAFLLNDFNLLSYQIKRASEQIGDGGQGESWMESYLFDLVTGRELALASQFRPGFERPLRRLIRWHLLHDQPFDFINKYHQYSWDWRDSIGQQTTLVALPEGVSGRYDDNGHASCLVLTGSGLNVIYPTFELHKGHGYGPEVTIPISYRELRPLVRPGTPLARMLQARGL